MFLRRLGHKLLNRDDDAARLAKRKASEDGRVPIEELRGYEEALSSELAALMGTLRERENMSREEFDRRMSWAHELETRLQSVRWDIERRSKPSTLRRVYLWAKRKAEPAP